MNEWFQALVVRFRRSLDQAVIVILGILLGVTVLLYWLEQQVSAPPIPQASIVPIPTPPKDPKEILKRFEHPRDLGGVAEYKGLLDFNMFDQRSVMDQSEVVARLDKEYERAVEAFGRGDLAGAETICNQIMSQMSSHRKTFELLRVIRAKRKELEPKAQP